MQQQQHHHHQRAFHVLVVSRSEEDDVEAGHEVREGFPQQVKAVCHIACNDAYGREGGGIGLLPSLLEQGFNGGLVLLVVDVDVGDADDGQPGLVQEHLVEGLGHKSGHAAARPVCSEQQCLAAARRAASVSAVRRPYGRR